MTPSTCSKWIVKSAVALVMIGSLSACAGGYAGRAASYVTAADVVAGRVVFDPSWLEQARARDQAGERPINAIVTYAPGLDRPQAWTGEGALGGVPVLIKDNIETRDMPTTAGSLALIANDTGRDAPIVARLRASGAVIMGKTNLSEWANIRSPKSISGWSAVGGLTRNPHDLARSACGSSSGSGAAVAAGLAPVAIGTETDGSIVCPAAVNGIVGFKPTVGLVSRTHIVPISHTQDTAGPMTLTVEDAAIVLGVIAGSDPADPATVEADSRKRDYHAALDANALSGQRIGVMRGLTGYDAATDAVFEQQLAVLRQAGAILVEIVEKPDAQAIGGGEIITLLTELKADLALYLASTDPAKVPVRTLADVIAFNNGNPRELSIFGQEFFEIAEKRGGLEDLEYRTARDNAVRLAGVEGIDRLLARHDVVALVAPTTGPAWQIDQVKGDVVGGSASQLAAVAGYPHLTVPMGQVDGLPVGMSFFGAKWDDARILSLGYAYEQKSRARITPRLMTGAVADGGDSESYRPYRR
ncbi:MULTISPECIES: amidase [unclassified Brevundimonas]|uniref:amidase n=1 Tax=unclassified Brevundimonas TaxID=2622653 RepID=UPI0025BB449C|nr:MULTISPECIES: amidase [unclassified Brevundimonas]